MDISCQQAFCVALEAFKAPHDRRTTWLVDSLALSRGEDPHLGCVAWDGNLGNDICAIITFFKDCLETDAELNFTLLWVLLDDGNDLEWQVDVL